MGEVLARVHQVAFSASGDYPVRILRPPPEIEQLHGLADWTAARGLLKPAEAQRFKEMILRGLFVGALALVIGLAVRDLGQQRGWW